MRSLKPFTSTALSVVDVLNLLDGYTPSKDPKTPTKAHPVCSLDDFLILEDLSCVDADGRVFEQYDQLFVRKDVYRDTAGKLMMKTPSNHIVYSESQDLFLPSFALTCTIVARLFAQRKDPDAERVLLQYKDKSDRNGWHAQNTLIDYAKSSVIHYPSSSDFSQSPEVNTSQERVALPFSKKDLEDALLKDALQDASVKKYVRQLTGLQNPEVLVDIGEYFSKPAKLWFPWSGKQGGNYKETRAVWFGCNFNYFSLNSNVNLSGNNAARGVRRAASAASPAP